MAPNVNLLLQTLLFSSLLLPLLSAASTLESEIEALNAFKNAVTNDPLSTLADWTNASHHCNWTGIACDSTSRVVSIILLSKQLAGKISPFIGNFSNLQVLDLSDNSFSGNVPSQLGKCSQLVQIALPQNFLSGKIPPELGNLKNLELLDLAFNLLHGNIPESIFNCTSLFGIGLGGNNFTGRISPSLGNLVNLQIFIAYNNSFIGSIPVSIGNLLSLQAFDLSQNQLSGVIPPEIGNLLNLEYLVLFENSFSGKIPSELGRCESLVDLQLYRNKFTGNFPSIYRLGSLISLRLSENKLTGTIPEEIGALKSLEVLTLHLNNFSGRIPASITTLKNLTELTMSYNSITGELPADIGSLHRLMNITMNNNFLEGSIPSSITNCTQLVNIGLVQNRITGKIPVGIGGLSNLTFLAVSENRMSGEIPDDLYNCSNLKILDVQGNNFSGSLTQSIEKLVNLEKFQAGFNSFTGPIPPEIGNLTLLVRLVLLGNRFSGLIPMELSKLSLLQGLSLSDNVLEGAIPDKLFELKQLAFLYLDENRLSGPIPAAFSNLQQLSQLDLHGNMFNGSIPRSIGSLTRLLLLDLSENRLTGQLPRPVLTSMKGLQLYLNLSHNFFDGTIPEEIGELEMVQAIDLSNNNLSGEIPKSLRRCLNLNRLDLSHNKLSGLIPAEDFAQIDLLTSLNLSYNNLEGKVPDTGIFKHIDSSSLLGNPSLCGKDYLTKCENSHQKSNKIILIFVVLGSTAIFLSVLLIYVLNRPVKKREPEELAESFTEPELPLLQRFEVRELEDATNCFGETNIIGMTSMSTVYKGRLENGQIIAVKKLNLNQFPEDSDKYFYREVKTMNQLRHRNLVKVIGYAWESTKLKAIVLEYMENGSLESVIHGSHNDQSRWTFPERIDVCISVATAMEYLHVGYGFPIVHCDLKPSNILLDKDWVAHVSDFGTARLLGTHLHDGSKLNSSSAFEGTIGYLAPGNFCILYSLPCKTVICHMHYSVTRDLKKRSPSVLGSWDKFAYMRKYTTKVDVFSFGITIMEFLTRRRPTGLTEDGGVPISLRQLVEKALANGAKGIIRVLDPMMTMNACNEQEVALEELMKLALFCTNENPENRPTMKEVLSVLEKLKARHYENVDKSYVR
ncbi:hypothetical protein ACFE04_029756 [Oxalis oulophora]